MEPTQLTNVVVVLIGWWKHCITVHRFQVTPVNLQTTFSAFIRVSGLQLETLAGAVYLKGSLPGIITMGLEYIHIVFNVESLHRLLRYALKCPGIHLVTMLICQVETFAGSIDNPYVSPYTHREFYVARSRFLVTTYTKYEYVQPNLNYFNYYYRRS